MLVTDRTLLSLTCSSESLQAWDDQHVQHVRALCDADIAWHWSCSCLDFSNDTLTMNKNDLFCVILKIYMACWEMCLSNHFTSHNFWLYFLTRKWWVFFPESLTPQYLLVPEVMFRKEKEELDVCSWKHIQHKTCTGSQHNYTTLLHVPTEEKTWLTLNWLQAAITGLFWISLYLLDLCRLKFDWLNIYLHVYFLLLFVIANKDSSSSTTANNVYALCERKALRLLN